jgi:peptidoglycan/xylan/chitin deacetylase (PgdA/CDA1 family)
MKSNLTIVMYHYVRPIKKSLYPNIKGLELEEFIEQLEYIRKHYHIISTSDFIEAKREKAALPYNALILTFDDGYNDHFEYVFPILKKLKLKATFFPIGKPCIERSILDVNKIHFILDSTVKYDGLVKYIEDCIRNSNLRNKSIEYYRSKYFKKNRFDSPQVNYIKRLLQVGLQYDFRTELVKNIFLKYVSKDEKGFADELYCNLDELQEMKSYGMEIGSHGYEHYWLNSLNKTDQFSDIKKSLGFLKLINNKNDNFIFCYPYGGYDDNTLEILDQFNCEAAFTTEVGLVDYSNDNILKLKRIDTNDLPKISRSKTSKWTDIIKNGR